MVPQRDIEGAEALKPRRLSAVQGRLTPSTRRRAARRYHPLYHPFNWRGWVDWGQGALGDMGAHRMDFPVWALNLGLPTVIETETTPFNGVCYRAGYSL